MKNINKRNKLELNKEREEIFSQAMEEAEKIRKSKKTRYFVWKSSLLH